MNVEDAEPSVYAPELDASVRTSGINVSWDTGLFASSVASVDVVIYGYDESNNNIIFRPILTLGEEIDINLGSMVFTSPGPLLQEDDFEVGVLGIVESRNGQENEG